MPDRPGIGGGNRPSLPDRPGVGGGDRPIFPDRPGIGGGDRPGIGGGDRPVFPDRPGIGGGDRPGIGGDRPWWNDSRPNWPSRRPVRPPDRPIHINNRPININNIRIGSRPWWDFHFHPWHRGYWGWWRPAGWFVGGVATGWMLAPSSPTFVFNNPFHDQSVTVFNYAQPLPPPPEDPVNDAASSATAEAAFEVFDRAREAFRGGNFKQALTLVDQSIQQFPTDATLHEFRALCLFALKDYKQAAASLYAVLAAGPGWDWETMKSLYGDTTTYTEQLRSLEAYQRANLNAAEASFVLAYHYLVLGHNDAAIKQLANVVRLIPDSQLSTKLLEALKSEPSHQPPAPG